MKQIVSISLLLAFHAAAGADAPGLARSRPAHGARDVPIDIGVIRLHFDQPMRTDSWTLWTSDKGEFPTQAGLKPGEEEPEPWNDPQTFELKIKHLKPNTTYALQLNSDRKKGFRSARTQEPLAVTTLVFTTGAGPGGTTKGSGNRNPLDGSDPGTKTVENPLDVKGPGAKTPDVKNPLDTRSPDTRTPDVKTPDVKTPDVKTPAAGGLTAEKLYGTWLMRNAQMEVSLVFSADGVCTRIVRTAEGKETTSARWELKGATLTMRDDKETQTLNVKMTASNTIEVTGPDGAGLRMVKQ